MSDDLPPRELAAADMTPKAHLPASEAAIERAVADLWHWFENVQLDAKGRAAVYRDGLLWYLQFSKKHSISAAEWAVYREYQAGRIRAQWCWYRSAASVDDPTAAWRRPDLDLRAPGDSPFLSLQTGGKRYWAEAIALWTTAELRKHQAPPMMAKPAKTKNSTKGAKPPAPEDDFVPAKCFIDKDIFPDFKALRRAIDKYRIETRKPSKQRLLVHAPSMAKLAKALREERERDPEEASKLINLPDTFRK